MPVRIEVRRIQGIFNLGDPGGRDLLPKELVMINNAKPSMIADIHVTPRKATESICLPPDNEALDQILSNSVSYTHLTLPTKA